MAVTSAPRATSASTRWLPMKPPAPVTKTFAPCTFTSSTPLHDAARRPLGRQPTEHFVILLARRFDGEALLDAVAARARQARPPRVQAQRAADVAHESLHVRGRH